MIRLLIAVVLLVPSLAFADVFTLHDAIETGLKKSLDIQMEEVRVSVKQSDVTAEEAGFDTVLTAGVSAAQKNAPTYYVPYNMDYLKEDAYTAKAGVKKRYSTGLEGEVALKTMRLEGNNPFESLDPAYKTMVVMNLTQPLLKNGGTAANRSGVNRAELAAKQARFDLYGRMIAKTAEIESAYYQLSRVQEILRLTTQARELAESLLDSDRKRYDAGIIPITEVQEAETAVAAREEQEISAMRDVELARHALETLIDTELADTPATEPLNGDGTEVSLDDAYETAFSMRPDLESQRIEVQKQDVTLVYRENQKLPELDLVGTLGLTGLSGEEKDASSFNGGYTDSYGNMTEGYEWQVGMNFSYPLGNRAAKARYQSAKGEKERSVHRLKQMETNIRQEIKDSASIIESSRKRYEVANTFIRLAEKTLEQEMKKLKEGLSDTFRVLKFQNDVIEAKIRAVNALYDYNQGEALLFKAEGTNLDRFGFTIGDM